MVDIKEGEISKKIKTNFFTKLTQGRKGVSLIVLVITVIVIIIIASAVILSLSNNNPISSANEAAFKNDIDSFKSELNMYHAKKIASDSLYTPKLLNVKVGSELTKLKEVIPSLKGKYESQIGIQNGELVIGGTATENELLWAADIGVGDGVLKEPPTVPVTENTKYNDGTGVAVIPKDFKVSAKPEEQKIDTGLVVIAPDGSEFVWVPVSNVDDMIDPETKAGKLISWTKGGSTEGTPLSLSSNWKEPDFACNGNDFDNNPLYLGHINSILGTTLKNGEDLKALMQSELSAIYESVNTNGGFYIGRYETGNLSTDNVVSKSENNDISNQDWYRMFTKQKKYASTEKLVSTGIKSNMIYGCQWDATMKWFVTSTNDVVKNYPVNAPKTHANFDGSKAATGSKESVNNIYDMAGNVLDWTAEAFASIDRSLRGWYYNGEFDYGCAAYRHSGYPINNTNSYGSRLALYL